MLEHYYYNLNTDLKGNHEVHRADCSYLPLPQNREYIGLFNSCRDAILKAKFKTGKENFDGCYWCARECHTG